MTAVSLPFCQALRVPLLVGISFLLLLGSATARCFGVPEGNPEEVLWSVAITARSDLGHEDGGTFGVAPSASVLYEDGLDELEPRPTEGPGLRLFFHLEQVLNFPPGKLNKSFIKADDYMDWVMRVEYRGTTPVQITLTWDVQEVLQASDPIELRLIDGDTTVDMLSVSSYVYSANPETKTFTVVAEPREDTGGNLLYVLVVAGYGGMVVLFLFLRKRRRKSSKEAQNP